MDKLYSYQEDLSIKAAAYIKIGDTALFGVPDMGFYFFSAFKAL